MKDTTMYLSLTDPILFLWLNQNINYSLTLLTPRLIKQILADRSKTYKEEQKLFIAWLWTFAQDKVIKKTRIRVCKSNDNATIKNNIECNDGKILDRNLILQLYKQSFSQEELSLYSKREKKVDFKNELKSFNLSLSTMRGEWKGFNAQANSEKVNIRKNIKDDESLINKDPFSKLTTHNKYSKKICGIKFEPPIPWQKVRV